MLIGSVLASSTALAVHDDGYFELDRNATSSAAPGDDWDVIDDGSGDPNNDDTADASSFTADGIGPTIFTGGGSKDDLNTTGWKHKSGQVPDKDELLDAYAARYDDILYFGADRYSNSGDAVMGFWFFQEEVTAQPGGSFGPGTHTDGDVLVLSDFTQGGGNVTIRVYQWNGPDGDIAGSGSINGTLDLLAGTVDQTADCVGPPSVPNGDPYCATVNTQDTASPWPFQAKAAGSPENVFPPGHFFEGGIDLGFLDLGEECFASFLAETRSSTSVDATLKDFVGGTFERCETTVTTTPSDASGDPLPSITLGDSIYDYALIEGTGSDNAPTGTMDFFICAPDELTSGTCATGGTEVNGSGAGALNAPVSVVPIAGTSNSEATSSAYVPDEIGTWCWRGVYSGDGNYPSASDSSTGECFEVTDIASTTTAQKWLPNDTATVTAAGGSTIAGSVVFSLYENGTCDGTAAWTSSPIAVVGGVAVSNNTTYYTDARTISWKAVFTSTNDVASGDAAHCESMTVSVLDNDITD
jgi:hypothetical protein